MASLNKAFLIGNLTRDPELRYLPSGTAVVTFSVAVNRRYTSQSGEKREDTIFMPIVVWGKRAETCGEYLNKGSAVFVEGRLQSRSWQGQDGQKRTTVEIVADNVQFLGRPKREGLQTAATAAARDEAQEPLDIVPDIDLPPDDTKDKKAQGEDEVPF